MSFHHRLPFSAWWLCLPAWQATSSGRYGIAMMIRSASPLTLGRDQPVYA